MHRGGVDCRGGEVILKDVNGVLIFPGQVHGLSVVDARHTPAIYSRPGVATHAIVVEGQELDHQANGSACMSETRSVLAWYSEEDFAQSALQTLLAAFQHREDVYRRIFAGEVRVGA